MPKSHSNVDQAPALGRESGPDYVALVIEWDHLADALAGAVPTSGTLAAPARGMSNPDQPERDPDWTAVDQASLESFPASDPPAWGSSHAAAEPPAEEPMAETGGATAAQGDRAAGRPRALAMYAVGAAALGALLLVVRSVRRARQRMA